MTVTPYMPCLAQTNNCRQHEKVHSAPRSVLSHLLQCVSPPLQRLLLSAHRLALCSQLRCGSGMLALSPAGRTAMRQLCTVRQK